MTRCRRHASRSPPLSLRLSFHLLPCSLHSFVRQNRATRPRSGKSHGSQTVVRRAISKRRRRPFRARGSDGTAMARASFQKRFGFGPDSRGSSPNCTAGRRRNVRPAPLPSLSFSFSQRPFLGIGFPALLPTDKPLGMPSPPQDRTLTVLPRPGQPWTPAHPF